MDSYTGYVGTGKNRNKNWNDAGGRQYVKGWGPKSKAWVERIYYAGSTEFVRGPYKIGYLRNGTAPNGPTKQDPVLELPRTGSMAVYTNPTLYGMKASGGYGHS